LFSYFRALRLSTIAIAARVGLEHLQKDSLLPIPGGWARMGHTHIPLAAASEDVLTGALRTAWKLRMDKNAKTSQKKPCGGAQRSNRLRNGHPNVTGCDYSAVEEGVAAQASPVGHTRGRVSKADGHKRRELRALRNA